MTTIDITNDKNKVIKYHKNKNGKCVLKLKGRGS